jgi:hypothetical protein
MDQKFAVRARRISGATITTLPQTNVRLLVLEVVRVTLTDGCTSRTVRRSVRRISPLNLRNYHGMIKDAVWVGLCADLVRRRFLATTTTPRKISVNCLSTADVVATTTIGGTKETVRRSALENICRGTIQTVVRVLRSVVPVRRIFAGTTMTLLRTSVCLSVTEAVLAMTTTGGILKTVRESVSRKHHPQM